MKNRVFTKTFLRFFIGFLAILAVSFSVIIFASSSGSSTATGAVRPLTGDTLLGTV